jgi:flagellar export protein FliJ
MPKQAKYNLQRLLEMRARTRESAIEVLAERRARLAAPEKELAAREKAVSDCRSAQRTAQSEMLEKSKDGIKNSEIIIHRQHLIDLRERESELIAAVEQQKTVVLRAEKEVEKALESLTEASKELQTIEKHRENWRQTKRIEMTRKEQKTNDEIGAILHERDKFE